MFRYNCESIGEMWICTPIRSNLPTWLYVIYKKIGLKCFFETKSYSFSSYSPGTKHIHTYIHSSAEMYMEPLTRSYVLLLFRDFSWISLDPIIFPPFNFVFIVSSYIPGTKHVLNTSILLLRCKYGTSLAFFVIV